jgi:hypothetical protein
MMEKEYILAEVRRTAQENSGVALGQTRLERETGIKQSDWRGVHWTCWTDALHEAGCKGNTWTDAFNEEYLIEKLVQLTKELGSFPTKAHIQLKRRRDNTFPRAGPFRRLGAKADLAAKVLAYCAGRPELQTGADVCTPMVRGQRKGPGPEHRTPEPEIFGFVYLMKSGGHFKTGRSNCAERRESELKILLPEKLELVHEIKTDDPVGIERYWHERFKDKRRGGEWFDLSASDVGAFRRRKFM